MNFHKLGRTTRAHSNRIRFHNRKVKSLLVEGIDPRSLRKWMPNEVEFLDKLNKQSQLFRVDGMQFLPPASLTLPILD